MADQKFVKAQELSYSTRMAAKHVIRDKTFLRT